MPRSSPDESLSQQGAGDPVANSVARLVGKPRRKAGDVGANLLVINSFAEKLAGEPGLEPRSTESESAVLPLNYSPA